MVEYGCQKCTKIFSRKGDYERHIARKTPCTFQKNMRRKPKILWCRKCKKKFNRIDVYKKHENNCKNKQINNKIKQNIIKKNINNGQFINGDINGGNNQFIIKNYKLLPFGKDGIECLTTPEKIAIFSSDENPMIIIKVNLDSNNISKMTSILSVSHSSPSKIIPKPLCSSV